MCQITDHHYPFMACACIDDKRLDLYFTKWGTLSEHKPAPRNCQSPRLTKVMENLCTNGYRQLRTFIASHQRRRPYRVGIDGDEGLCRTPLLL